MFEFYDNSGHFVVGVEDIESLEILLTLIDMRDFTLFAPLPDMKEFVF